jgi:hypothetical protein
MLAWNAASKSSSPGSAAAARQPALAHGGRRRRGSTAANVEHDVGDVGLEQTGGDALRIVDEPDRRIVHGETAPAAVTASHHAAADRREVCRPRRA